MAQDYYSFHTDDVIQAVERKLDDLKPFQYDSRYRRLLGDTFVRRISEWERNIRNRKNDPFTLVVCGEFKRGKSSLINALLGEDVVPTDITPETLTLNRLSYGLPSNEVVFASGRRMKISDEELRREQLQALMNRTGESIRFLEIQRPIELLKRITIVDTPGLNDDQGDFSEMVDHSLKQADAVIYVFNSNYPLSRTEQLFLKAQVIPQKYTDLFLVANHSDILNDAATLERMQELVEERISNLLPGRSALMISALDERCRQCGEERPSPKLEQILAANFQALRNQLDELIEQKQYMVIPDRMQRLLRAMAEDLSGLLDSTERGLDMSEQDLQKEAAIVNERCEQQISAQVQLHQQISDNIAQMQLQTHQWMGDFLNRIEREVSTLAGTPADDLRKYYSFYCIDMIQEAMNKCIDRHTEVIYDMLDEISYECAKSLTRSTDQKQYHFRFALDNQTWTNGDNVSYVASWLGLGSLSIISDGITGALRQKEMAEQAPDLIRRIREQYPQLRQSVVSSIDGTYERIRSTTLEQLSTHQQTQIRNAKELVEQSALVARQSLAEKDEIRGIIAMLRELIADIDKL